jgi:hypothetical protein
MRDAEFFDQIIDLSIIRVKKNGIERKARNKVKFSFLYCIAVDSVHIACIIHNQAD